MRKTKVRRHLRRTRHGKSVVRHHRRTIKVPRRMAQFSGEKELKEIEARKKAYEEKAKLNPNWKGFAAGYNAAITDLDLQPDLEEGKVLGTRDRVKIYAEKMKTDPAIKALAETREKIETLIKNTPDLPKADGERMLKKLEDAEAIALAKRKKPIIDNPL